ncbi:hypothetical protein Pla163_00640 [Planctomycetes bacterium Pla163]|uniref:Uncharacterized protein n=1 Tax=Rohdeia mirabilis TaxID=2528008 RepID=A0A518CUR8_9BACT|nr:hypothetical protein Pla163_00640 [Planctomycetes bacterium Pla163]
MAHKQTYLFARKPGLESRLDSLARFVKILAVLITVYVLGVSWDEWLPASARVMLVINVVAGLLFAWIFAAILNLLAEHLRLRRSELELEYDGDLEREAEYRSRCSECARPIFNTDARCTNCGAVFDEIEPPAGSDAS